MNFDSLHDRAFRIMLSEKAEEISCLTTEPVCDIVILNFNGKSLVEQCIKSIQKINYTNYNVILVDNASSDGSVDYLKALFPWVKIVRNSQNLGFGGGMNAALKHVNGEYILFLNNDTRVDPSCLLKMVKTAASDPSIGVVTCKLLDLDNPTVIDAVGGFIIDAYGFPYAIGHGEIDRHQYDTIRYVFALGILLIRRSVFEKIGGFDAAYFTYGEDIDLCWRVQLAGYKIVANPSAVIYHKSGGGTLSKGKTVTDINFRSKIRYLTERNTLRTLLKNYSCLSWVTILPRYLGLLFGELVLFLAMRKIKLFMSDLKAILWNIWCFRDVYYLHKKVQLSRVVDDGAIKEKMIRGSLKIAQLDASFSFFSNKVR